MSKQMMMYIVVAVVLLAGIGYFIFNDLKYSEINVENNSTTTPEIVTKSISKIDDIYNDGIPEEIIPDLDREFIVPDVYSEEIRQNTIEQYDTMASALKEDPNLRDEWLQLALLRKAVEDYLGAEEIWIFMTKVWTLDHVAFGNLGDLYLNHLVDLDKAEENFILAAEKQPNIIQNIQNLYEFFRYRRNNPDQALSILIQGYQLFPKEIYYPIRIAEHYRDAQDIANTKKYFEQALKLATTPETSDLKAYIEEELNKL
jgi:tetratricopeptide (TPR) repeat protein